MKKRKVLKISETEMPPIRYPNCKNYDECADIAAFNNKLFECAKCPNYKPTREDVCNYLSVGDSFDTSNAPPSGVFLNVR